MGTSQTVEVYAENAVEKNVDCPEDVLRLVNRGLLERHSRDTQMNDKSSRSHLIVCLRVSSVNRQTGRRLHGKLLLIDMAGSERVKRSEVTGEAMKEACEINKSLSALTDVVQALVRSDSHVPYRNHELTQVMQDSIGGTAKTLMFVNLSPSDADRDESLLSLKYAGRV